VGEVSGVARELRLAREAAGLTREQAAERTGLSPSLIDKVERGVVPVSDTYTAAFAKAFPPAEGIYGRLREDERRDHAVPDWFRPWFEHEQEAIEIRWYEPLLVPGLLQTEAYARALLGDDDRIAARIGRQRALDRAAVMVIIDEGVLSRRIGDAATMADQLSLLATTTRAEVQVLPATAETYLGTLGSFALALVDGVEVAYADNPLHGIVQYDPGVISEVKRRWDALRGEALPRGQSRELIAKVAERWKSES
jgi:transcriptional regulator with XRE-family HTH domain